MSVVRTPNGTFTPCRVMYITSRDIVGCVYLYTFFSMQVLSGGVDAASLGLVNEREETQYR
jgi:hypothetical protein